MMVTKRPVMHSPTKQQTSSRRPFVFLEEEELEAVIHLKHFCVIFALLPHALEALKKVF